MAAVGAGVVPLTRRLVCVAYFLLFFGVGVWVPYFPLWLHDLGYSGWQVGLACGLQPVVRGSSAIAYAYVADRWRIRHRLIVATALAGTVAFVPVLFLQRFDAILWVLALVALLHGPLVPMVDAAVMDDLPALGGDYGRLRLWGSIGFIVGAWGSAPIVHATSSAVVPLLLLLAFVPLPLALAQLPSSQRGHAMHFQAPWRLLTRPLAVFLGAGFLLQASCGAWSALYALHTESLGFPDTVPGLTFGFVVVVEVLVLYWGRPMLERFSPAPMLLVILLVNAVRWALTAVATREVVVIALQIGHVFSFTAFHLAALVLLNRMVPPENATGGQALYALVTFGLGSSAGQLLAGALVGRLGTAGVFGFEALVAAAGVPFAVWLLRLVD